MGFCCIASSFYIKPQLDLIRKAVKSRCIASSFYIKPQQSSRLPVPCRVVLHPLSTSNHNWFFFVFFIAFVVLHPLSTSNHNPGNMRRSETSVVLHPLSTSNHNWPRQCRMGRNVVLHPLSTSNHNGNVYAYLWYLLYCILFLHQTTTYPCCNITIIELYCILFLHQTTTTATSN